MSMHQPIDRAAAERGFTVSASKLVRRFGYWQERASEAPVFVLHHGRPRWALLSTGLLAGLTAESDEIGRRNAAEARLGLVLDHMRMLAVFADESLAISRLNRAARVYFGSSADAMIGLSLEAVAPPARAQLLFDAAARVRDTGIEEGFDFESRQFPDRRLAARLVPLDRGVGLFLEDMTLADDVADARDRAADVSQLCETLGDAAFGTISPRGLITLAPDALATMTGIPCDQIVGVRFTSLLDIADRPAMNAAIDHVFDTGAPARVAARLLKRGAEPIAVAVAIAGGQQRLGQAAVRYLIVRQGDGADQLG